MMAMRISARRPAVALLILFLVAVASFSSLPGAAPGLDDSYIQTDFGEIASRPERFRDKRVCVTGGWIRRDILVDVDRINRPYKCTIEVERYDPKVIEEAAQLCIRRYGQHVDPNIRLWDVPEVKEVAPEACVIACGVFTVNQPPGLVPVFWLETETIEPCP